MKILWVKNDFLHPTNRGGQIRTLELLRRLHARHEVHYVGYHEAGDAEALARSGEYSTHAYPVPPRVANRHSLSFRLEALKNLASPLPLSVQRYASPAMRDQIAALRSRERYDSVVCDFIHAAINFPDPENFVLFQHNVESVIWQRHRQQARNPLLARYFHGQANRMHAFEHRNCHAARQVIAVSDGDAQLMRTQYGTQRITVTPTGVDLRYFTPTAPAKPFADLIFLGAMDWLPNLDGVRYFVSEILPVIRQRRPETTVALVGRNPVPEVTALTAADPRLIVTGTVPDVRPYLWGSLVSIVPLRIGGGTRLKIYEAMAARVPTVSTSIGAEGLTIHPPANIRIADDPASFATHCLQLLDSPSDREQVASQAWDMVAKQFSWDSVVDQFEAVLARS